MCFLNDVKSPGGEEFSVIFGRNFLRISIRFDIIISLNWKFLTTAHFFHYINPPKNLGFFSKATIPSTKSKNTAKRIVKTRCRRKF